MAADQGRDGKGAARRFGPQETAADAAAAIAAVLLTWESGLSYGDKFDLHAAAAVCGRLSDTDPSGRTYGAQS